MKIKGVIEDLKIKKIKKILKNDNIKNIFWDFLWCSQDLDLSLLLLVFSLLFTVVSRLLLLYSTIDKTSRLKMKSFSTCMDTQRSSQSYMEKRRGRRESEVT